MSFYVTLPWNASQVTYPGNTASNYTVKLPESIYLPESDWEVALASISFPDLISQVAESEDENYVDIELELAKHQPTSLTMDTVLWKSTPPVKVLPL